jgi:Ca2+-binding EF-hand superfamily protein
MLTWLRCWTFLLVTIAIGCGSTPPTADKPSTDTATKDASQDVEVRLPSGDETKDDSSIEVADVADASTNTVADEPLPRAERILLFAPGGPLIVDVYLTIDGRPYQAAFESLIDHVLKTADTDGDGRVMWSELTLSPQFMYGQFGNTPMTSEVERYQAIQNYDVNRDGRVDRSEVPRFLTRNMGSSRAFTLRTSNQYRGDNQFQSLVRRLLDVDEDGRLSSDEIAAAPVRLRSRDADDDELLFWADFQATSNLAGDATTMRRRSGPDGAVLLEGNHQWPSLLYALEELYAYGGKLEAGSFPLVPRLFERLDTNGDGTIDREEVAAIGSIEPLVEIDVRFGDMAATDGSDIAAPKLLIKSLAADLSTLRNVESGVVSEREGRISLSLPGVKVEIAVNDATVGEDYESQAQSQFAAYDADGNGYLEKNELPEEETGLAASFAALDADGDGKVYLADVEAFLKQQRAALLSQIYARAGDTEDALFTALDADGDGRLNSREIAAASDRLQSLDHNRDGLILADEIPGSMSLVFTRGDVPRGDALFTVPLAAGSKTLADTPRWFDRMDANGDSVISSREFLGSTPQFQQLDANNDGFLDRDEARSMVSLSP